MMKQISTMKKLYINDASSHLYITTLISLISHPPLNLTLSISFLNFGLVINQIFSLMLLFVWSIYHLEKIWLDVLIWWFHLIQLISLKYKFSCLQRLKCTSNALWISSVVFRGESSISSDEIKIYEIKKKKKLSLLKRKRKKISTLFNTRAIPHVPQLEFS